MGPPIIICKAEHDQISFWQHICTWYFVTKIVLTYCENCSSDQEKPLKFVAEGREFAKFWRSLKHLIQTVKGQNNFW